MLERKS